VSRHDDEHLPPLPEEVRLGLSAFRNERPSPRFPSRLDKALQEAEARGASAGRIHSHHPVARGLLCAVVCSLSLLMVRTDGASGVQPSLQVSFQLPGQGAGWLELPWSHDIHSGEPATVRLETPAELDFHQHAAVDIPSLRLVSCDEGRCVHQFRSDTGTDVTPLRVRIDKPGRYEFRVSHASDVREVHEHFVVVAEH
jgi:hypothetical protein